MLSPVVRILDFDASVTRQKELAALYKPEVIDFLSLGSSCRMWISQKYANKLKEKISSSQKNRVTFLGSGDFHHISFFLIQQFQEPLNVIVFDHHPDWFVLPPKYGCGSWVSALLKLDNVKKVISLGVSSQDLDTFGMFTSSMASLKKDKLEIYPYEHAPTTVPLRRVPKNISITRKRKLFSDQICWNQLRGGDLRRRMLDIIERLPSSKVYVSIDKDCLKKEYALTNWEEGRLSLEELLAMLKVLRNNLDIVGLDITGEYSKPKLNGRLRKYISESDHPRDYTAKNLHDEVIDRTNEKTNLKILDAILNKR